MRALITGGAGFIGPHLADALLAPATASSCSTSEPLTVYGGSPTIPTVVDDQRR